MGFVRKEREGRGGEVRGFGEMGAWNGYGRGGFSLGLRMGVLLAWNAECDLTD